MSKHNNFSIEKAKQQINIIRNTLPGYMVPGFVRLVNENSEKVWFIEFINLYAEFVKDAIDKNIDIISPATALNEYMKKFEKSTEEAVELSEPEANEAVQDEVPEELVTVDDVYDDDPLEEIVQSEIRNLKKEAELLMKEARIADDLDELENEEELPEGEPVDII